MSRNAIGTSHSLWLPRFALVFLRPSSQYPISLFTGHPSIRPFVVWTTNHRHRPWINVWEFLSLKIIVLDNDHYLLPTWSIQSLDPVGRTLWIVGCFNIRLLCGSKDIHVWILLTPDFVWNQDHAADMKQMPSLPLMRIMRHSGHFHRLSGTVVTICTA